MPANAAARRYELKELLGEGGMGVVYRALDKRTNSYVALKTLRDAADPATLDMFKREWEELGKLVHPNIVDVRDVDEIEENGVWKPCFIMPLLPGCTLASLIKSSSPRLTTDFVVNMAAQVCKGLQAAHEKDLIHRDLKPSNIFIMEDDTAKIIDFGLVHAIGNKSITGLKGTWQYMAPEQIDGSKQPNRSFDIFALGVVAYEALTGHQPFRRAKFEDTAEAVRHFVPQAISERNPKVPQLVSQALHVALAKQPIHRYATAREFAETLQKAHQGQYIERFDPAKIRPRIERAKRAFTNGDCDFASEILTELEAEGNLDTDITLLRSQIDEYNKHKRVRQLFEAAQTRLEQEEIPLALEKLQEILKVDPQNSEALKLRKYIEQQRSQQQVSEWLALARKHLDRHDFGEARRALKEVFNLKYDDPDAARLKAQVDTREKEVETARAEKEHLYGHALRDNQNGEISSALSKLEKLLELSRGVPGASVPERDKVFQAFYNDVRSERDRIDNAYAEGARHLTEKNFEKALQICDGILTRYPQNPRFQALRLKVEHSQRQELSAYIAEVGRAVDTEPNLDRRVGLLEEACKRYSHEGQFSRQLSLARDLRDLVASIVDRARNYEERNQFAEAIAQLNTLSNIHPQYPGIEFEINQLERRREQQAQEDKKFRLVEKIDRALGNAAYADGERLSQEGLTEFPQNPELLALLRLSREGLDQTREANRLFEEAKTQRSSGNWDQAVALLRQALDLDHRNIVVVNTLVNLLVERAHTLLDRDPSAAESLAAEAGRLDPEHPSVKKLIALIAEAKRKNYVERTVLQARELQTTNRDQAITILKQGLTVYPGEGRLQQTLFNLQKDEPRVMGASAIGATPEAKTVVYPINDTERPPIPPPPPKVVAPPKPAGPPRWKILLEQISEANALFVQNLQERLNRHSRDLIGVLLGLLASVILLGFAYRYFNRPAPPPLLLKLQVPIRITPADSTVLVDGITVSNSTPPLEKGSHHKIVVSRLGYQTIENPTIEVTSKPWEFSLAPEPLHISVSVSQANGSIWLDDQRVADLDDGSWSSLYPFKASEEQHVLTVRNRIGEQLFKVTYSVVAGKPAIVSPLQTKDLLVASSLGKDATLYAGNPSSKLAVPGQEQKPIPAEGLAVNVEDTAGNFPIASGKRAEPLTVGTGQAPMLSISLNAAPKVAQRGMPLSRHIDTQPKGPIGPAPATLILSDGTPGATVSVDDSQVGELDEKGNGRFAGIAPGTHTIQLSKASYSPVTFYGKNFAAGKPFELGGNKKLSAIAGYARISVKPADAAVFYRRTGESEKHQVLDFAKVLTLQPGSYELTAEAPHYIPDAISEKILRDQTSTISFDLQPLHEIEKKVEFVNPDEVIKKNGDWYHGRTDNFIRLLTTHKTNTIVFSKEFKVRKMSWRVSLDGSTLTFTLDAKGVSVVKVIDGERSNGRVKDVDLSGATNSAPTYAVQIKMEKNDIIIARQDGTVVGTVHDDKHDWSHARIFVKGDTYFTFSPGR